MSLTTDKRLDLKVFSSIRRNSALVKGFFLILAFLLMNNLKGSLGMISFATTLSTIFLKLLIYSKEILFEQFRPVRR